MFLDLSDVLRLAGNSVEKPIHFATGALEDIEFVEPVTGLVRAVNARQNVVVSGTATAVISMTCARCLTAYPQRFDLDLEAVAPLGFFRGLITGAPDEDSDPDDELAALFDPHSLNVLELVRQAVVLQWPIKPLCSPGCEGLPAATNYQDTEDERWIALKNWKGNHDGSA